MKKTINLYKYTKYGKFWSISLGDDRLLITEELSVKFSFYIWVSTTQFIPTYLYLVVTCLLANLIYYIVGAFGVVHQQRQADNLCPSSLDILDLLP